ncbi:hypothetical protein B0T14DRAFT_493933 [Immersiella caudata]|uniref:FAD-binding domain-containing protein n=1 Tax=Immersiella caudata TaxID=314043 RepID=A0AA40C719_9PEZI|nr:hypothetical protein B0T14DRAFT_493933 [Immersiella caudata]
MKVIIVGAGFSGVSTYLLLCKLLPSPGQHTILLYEAYDSRVTAKPASPSGLVDTAVVVGNIISLEAGAVRLLRYVDEELCREFKAKSYANEHYTFRSARGHTIAVLPAGDHGDQDPATAECTISCPRYEAWKWLHETVGYDNIRFRRVVNVDLSGKRPVVQFADGEFEEADLVVGADGVKSVVKKAIFGEQDATTYAPHFEGFCGVGAFVDVPELPPLVAKRKSMIFTFGPTGSFGYCSAAPEARGKLSWWSNWASSDIPDANIMDAGVIREQLRGRHGTWKDPAIQKIISLSTTDRIYPVWTTPDLPYWGRSGAVLLGDAAHTLQAMSGQGANQALEDSVAFAMLLSHYMQNLDPDPDTVAMRESIELATKALYELRGPRVARIRQAIRKIYIFKSRINSAMIEYWWYLCLYTLLRVPLFGSLCPLSWLNKRPKVAESNPLEYVPKYLARVGQGPLGAKTGS